MECKLSIKSHFNSIFIIMLLFFIANPFYFAIGQIHNNGTLHVGENGSLFLQSGDFTFGNSSGTTTSKSSTYSATNGKIILSATSNFDTDGANSKFVNGYVQTTSTSSFFLATGATNYAPVRVQASAPGVHVAYFSSSPSANFSAILNPSVLALADAEYWIVKGGNATVTLSWRVSSNLSTYSSSELTIVGFRSGAWEIIPSAIDGTSIYGTASDITSTGSISSIGSVDLSQYEAFALGKKGDPCIDLLTATGTKTWSGSAWFPAGNPTVYDNVTLNAPYSAGSFSCNSLNFNGNNVTLSNGQSLEIVRGVSGIGKVIMSSESSLVQRDPSATKPQIELTKTTRPIKRYDYVYWGTPIVENAFSQLDNAVADGQTTAGAFDFKYRYVSGDLTATGGWQTLSSTAPGQGFIMRVKQQAPFVDATTAENINLRFVGTANNGDITAPIAYASANPASARNNSLLANPYPSAIDADKFLEANAGLLDGAIYLWRANTTNVTGASNYVVADYIAYTKAGSTAYAGTLPSGSDFDGFIASGQGFKVRALQSGTAQFNNCMRVLTNNNQFFRSEFDANSNVVKDRYKVNIRNSNGFANQILVAYLPETSLNYDYMYDAELITVSQTNLYSVLENTGSKLAINSRGNFDSEDQVALGYVHNTSSNPQLTIDVEQREGIFNNNQTTIYLFDSLLNVYHDFANGGYSFTATSAQDNTRFKLVYENSTLGSDDFNSNMAYAMLNDNKLQINASLPIKNVQVFDITGRLIMNETLADSNSVFITPFNKPQAVYIVKISLDNGKIVTNKVINRN